MKDIFGIEIKIGDTVCFAPSGAYAGICVGSVVKFTPKNVCIMGDVKGRHIDSKLYYAPPRQIAIVPNKI